MTTAPPAGPCRNCGAVIERRFCPDCGQEALALDASTGQVLREFFADATDLDGRVARTIRTLLAPGALTLAWLAGRRIPFLGPVKLFLGAGTVLTATWVLTRNIDARFYALAPGAYGLAATYIDTVVRGSAGAVAVMSLGNMLVSAGRRRLLDEIVFTLHLVAALAIGTAATIWLGTGFKVIWGSVDKVPGVVPTLPVLLFAPAALAGVVYTLLASRAVHGGAWWVTLLRTVVLWTLGLWVLNEVISRAAGA